jgi:putative DNA primase/helicase
MVAETKKQRATQPTETSECTFYTDAVQASSGYEHLNDCNDTGNAQRFLLQYGKRVLYVAGAWQKWLIWNKKCWEIDTTKTVEKLFKSSIRTTLEMVSAWMKEYDDWKNKSKETAEGAAYQSALIMFRYLKSSLNTSKVKAGLESAQSENVTINHEVLNQTKKLLVCSNGTINLVTGELEQSNPDALYTSYVKTDYDQEAVCPRWMQFLKEILITEDGKPDDELIAWIQKLFGCAVTGLAPRENVFPIFYGSGGNGKSTLLKVIQTILGDDICYGCDPSFLCESKGNQHPTSLATTFGKKLVIAQEPPPGARLNTSLIKSITGGDQMTTRRLFENEWMFYPEYLLLYSTNEKPTIKESTKGIWRRVRLVPFLAVFAAGTENRNLAEVMLNEEAAGILSWIVAGAKAYLAEGLICPERILTETERYRSEEDIVATWIADCCTIIDDTSVRTKASDVQASFKKWCDLNNVRSNKNDLTDGLKRRGVSSLKSGVNWWLKITLNDPNND